MLQRVRYRGAFCSHVVLGSLVVVSALANVATTPAQAQEPVLSPGAPLGLAVTSAAGRTAVAGVIRLAVVAAVVGPVAFEWSADGGHTWSLIAVDAEPLDSWSATWDSRPFSGDALVRAVAGDGAVEVIRVVVDNRPPRVRIRLSRNVTNGERETPVAGVVIADEPVAAILVLAGRHGREVLRLELQAKQANRFAFTWHGRRRGSPVRDGVYRLGVRVVDRAGNEAQAADTVVLDTTPPTIGRPQVHAGSRGRSLRVSVRVAERNVLASVDLRVRSVSGNSVESVRHQVRGRSGLVVLHWRPVRPLRPGAYRIEIVARDSADNTTTTAAPPQLIRYPVRTTVVSRVETNHRHVALTFDDCYHPGAWNRILDILARAQLRATFFCPGQAVLAAPQTARRTLEQGHAIGSHGWDHATFTYLPFASALQRLLRDSSLWWHSHRAAATPYFRPPYGAYSPATLAAAGAAGYTNTVLWDVDPRDWTRPGTALLTQRILANVRPGSIILLHTLSETAAALPTLLDALRQRRLLPVSIDELLAASHHRTAAPGWPWATAGVP